ncbi:MAG: dinB [Nitrospira sp.]|jgi:nucleotidyltransferase/DNA polymerase involved in DNA repair|nr:dinB [Nitrospira sp.]
MSARWPRQVLFGDIDAMFASAAVLADPSLEGKPVAVGGPPPRGIIAAASYAVRRFGVHSAMPTIQALRLCPHLVLVPPDRPLYQRLHRELQTVTARFFPETEWTSVDEFYTDTTKLQTRHPDPRELGLALKAEISRSTGLTCTVALASGKAVAKIAASTHKPDGLSVIEPGCEPAFLAPLPIGSLPGMGPKSTEAVQRLGVRVIGDLLAPRFESTLFLLLGTRMTSLQSLARGVDTDPVVADRETKSMSHETTFDEDTDDLLRLEPIVHGFLEQLTHDLRMEGLAAGSFTIKLKDARFRITTRQRTFSTVLNYDPDMWPDIRRTLVELMQPGARYRLVGLGLSNLVSAPEPLFDRRQREAVAILDQLIERHGAGVVRLGGLPRSDEGDRKRKHGRQD